jgi:hypothetical protein
MIRLERVIDLDPRVRAPITRSIVRRGNQRALERLAEQLPPGLDA